VNIVRVTRRAVRGIIRDIWVSKGDSEGMMVVVGGGFQRGCRDLSGQIVCFRWWNCKVDGGVSFSMFVSLNSFVRSYSLLFFPVTLQLSRCYPPLDFSPLLSSMPLEFEWNKS
jgi:hypothetical protein